MHMVTETQRLTKIVNERPVCRLCGKRIYSKYWQRLDPLPDPVHSDCIKDVLDKRYAGHARWR